MPDYLVCTAKNDEERDAFEKEALAGPMRETIDSGLIDYDVATGDFRLGARSTGEGSRPREQGI